MSDVLYKLVSPHLPAESVHVASFSGTEAMSEAYTFDVVCHAAMPVDAMGALEMRLPGSRASLQLAAASEGSRWVHGVVTELHIERSLHRGDVEIHVRIAPRLSLLGLTTGSAIYQDMSVPEIAAKLLDAWGIQHEARLDGTYPKRTYLTQYEETDYAFLKRILAGVGIFFCFEQPELPIPTEPAEEKLVLCDAAGLYSPIPGDDHLRFVEPGGGLEGAALFDHVTRFGRVRRLRPQRVLLGDFDHRNPGLMPSGSLQAERRPEVPAGPEQLRAYHHGMQAEIESTSGDTEADARHVRHVLEQHRAEALTAGGTSHSRRLRPGATFVLDGHPVDHLNAGYAITRVQHTGRVPELTGGEADASIYENRFECVPEYVPARPEPQPPRRRQVAETATVVGAGDDIHTDDFGRIRVKFHWDLSDREGDKASCWLRVAQPWAGTHFGAQFIPRVGDEVIVTFLGGDTDRPIVTGSVYNGTHPNPFDLPDQKATSGFRTQSTPGGSGYNELSFCDRAGEERIFMRAERDLVQEVEVDHKLEVKRNQTLTVTGEQMFQVASGQTMQIGGAQLVSIEGNQQLMAAGSGLLAYGGDTDIQVGRQLTTRIDGREKKEVRAQSNALYRDDCVTKVLGHHTTIVGEHDARRAFNVHVEGTAESYASGAMSLSSDKELELRVGESMIRITEEGIELSGPSFVLHGDSLTLRADEQVSLEAPDLVSLKSKKVFLESESAHLGLGKVAKLKGELVKLNCEDDPVDDLEPPEPPKLTTIELADEEGQPIPNQRYVLVMPDGSQRTGTLDEEGKAEVVLEESGDIIFPDVHNPRPA